MRQKPEGYRKRFTFFAAASITLAIFAVWLTTLPYSIRSIEQKTAKSESTEPTPLGAARQNIGAAIDGIKDQFGEAKQEFNTIKNQPEKPILEDGNTVSEPQEGSEIGHSSDYNQGQ